MDVLALIFICEVSCAVVILPQEFETLQACNLGINELVIEFQERSGSKNISGACDIGDPITYRIGRRFGS